MSNPGFAPITSDLLARKGDAIPSTLAVKPSLFWRRTPAAAGEPVQAMAQQPAAPRDLRAAPQRSVQPSAAPQPTAAAVVPPVMPPDQPKPHRMMVTLTANEYERLGIASVKKGVTRHQIVRTALDLHLDRLKREYGGCGCMAMGSGNCGEGCGV